MASVALSGNDTISLNNYTLTGLATGDVAMLTYPSEIAQVKTGKNGNSVYGLNETGKQCEFKVRVLRGSADDKFLLAALNAQQQNFAGTVLMIGTFIKKIGDGQGNITSDTYIMSGGVFMKQVEAKMNIEGDEQQSIAEYMIRFSNAPRALT